MNPTNDANLTGTEAGTQRSEPPALPDSKRGWSWGALAIFLLLWLGWGAVLMTAKVSHPGLEAGEYWGDANILLGGRWFDEYGMRNTAGFPSLELGQDPDGDEYLRIYDTYPPGPYWFREVLKRIGLGELVHIRVTNQAIGLVAALLAFFCFWAMTGGAWLAVLGGSFYMLNTPFASYSSSLHNYPAGQATAMLAILGWLMFRRKAARGLGPVGLSAWLWLGVACAAVLLNTWTTFEQMLLIAAFVGVTTFLPPQHLSLMRFAGAAALGGSMALAVGLRVMHNGIYHGGLRAGFDSLFRAAGHRSDLGTHGISFERFISAWQTRLGWPWSGDSSYAHNAEFAFPVLNPWVLVPTLVLLGVLLGCWRTPWAAPARRAIGYGLLLLVGWVLWLYVMTDHAWHHRFIVLLVLPGAALIFAGVVWAGIGAAARGHASRVLAPAAIAVLFAAYLSDLRTNDTLNQLWELDERVHARVLERREVNERLARVGERMGDVDRLFIKPKQPWRAEMLQRPWIFVVGEPPEELSISEGLYIDAWGPDRVRVAVDAMRRFGLPDAITSPPHRAMVFRGGGERGATLDFPFNEKLRITRMRWAETLDGESVALTVRVSGELDRDLALRFNFALRAFDENGEEIASNIARIGWQHIFDDRDGRVVMMLPAETVERAHQIRFRVRDNAESRVVPPEFVGRRPAWIRLAVDGTEMAWNPQAPHPRRRPPQQTPDPQQTQEPDSDADPATESGDGQG